MQLHNYFLNNIFLFSILDFSSKLKVVLNKLTSLAQKFIVTVGWMLVSEQYGINRVNYLRTLGVF